MLVKLIVCRTTDAPVFAEGQRTWRRLAALPGFLGQFGGWSTANDHEAVILSLWQDEAAYRQFMAATHDGLYAASGQSAVMASVQTACFREDVPIPGRQPDLGALVSILTQGDAPEMPFLRLVDCTVHAEAREDFRDSQRTLWNPALKANGVLAGTFACGIDEPHRFLTASVWVSAADHDAYNRNAVPQLMRHADVISKCRAITGRIVIVEPAWSVSPTP
jgi:quinol monooxygenase YgiN